MEFGGVDCGVISHVPNRIKWSFNGHAAVGKLVKKLNRVSVWKQQRLALHPPKWAQL